MAVFRVEGPGWMDKLALVSVGVLSPGWRTQAVDAAGGTMGLEKRCPRAHRCPLVWPPISRVILVLLCSLLVFLTVSSLSGLGHPLLSCLCCE